MKITITHPEGSAPYAANVVASNASTHIAARDSLASEAEALLHYMDARKDGCDYDEIPGWKMIDDEGDSMTYETEPKKA